jgi:hypothetical protein
VPSRPRHSGRAGGRFHRRDFLEFRRRSGRGGHSLRRRHRIRVFEMPAWCARILFVAYLLIGVCALLTFHQREPGPLYPSQWFVVGSLFWFPWIFSTAARCCSMCRRAACCKPRPPGGTRITSTPFPRFRRAGFGLLFHPETSRPSAAQPLPGGAGFLDPRPVRQLGRHSRRRSAAFLDHQPGRGGNGADGGADSGGRGQFLSNRSRGPQYAGRRSRLCVSPTWA